MMPSYLFRTFSTTTQFSFTLNVLLQHLEVSLSRECGAAPVVNSMDMENVVAQDDE